MIAVAAPAAEHGSDVAVDGFHLAERDLDVAVGEDAVEVATQQLGDPVEGGQALPAQGANPGGQKLPRRPRVGVVPEARQLLLEEMGFGEPPVEGEQVPELAAARRGRGCPRRGAAATAGRARARGPRRPGGRTRRAGFRPGRR